MPNKGILIVELKGWREETVLRVEDDQIVIKTQEGEAQSSPLKQARGYRFSLQRYIKNALGVNPLIFQMVCFPQVSRECYHQKRLDIVCEEKFTILKEDLETNAEFYKKLDDALREVTPWNRDPFTNKLLYAIRNLFEPAFNPQSLSESSTDNIQFYKEHNYSRFYFFSADDQTFKHTLADMVQEYSRGCKLYCVFSTENQLAEAVSAIDSILVASGLIRVRDQLEINFDGSLCCLPAFSGGLDFSAFHCSFSLLQGNITGVTKSFTVVNGQTSPEQRDIMMMIDQHKKLPCIKEI